MTISTSSPDHSHRLSLFREGRTVWGLLASFVAVGGLLIVWKVAAGVVAAPILLPDPEAVLKTMTDLGMDSAFWRSAVMSAGRVLAGFALSVIAGLAVGIPAGIHPVFHSGFFPILSVVRATPVMSVILIALLCFSSGAVPVFAAFLIGFPVVVQNVITGIQQTDPRLLEMGRAYGLTPGRMVTDIYIPSTIPYLTSGAQTALGLTWKVIVAAEVMSLPRRGIGTGMQYAQMRLETAEVLAWTAAVILCAGGSQWLLSRLSARFPRGNDYADPV